MEALPILFSTPHSTESYVALPRTNAYQGTQPFIPR